MSVEGTLNLRFRLRVAKQRVKSGRVGYSPVASAHEDRHLRKASSRLLGREEDGQRTIGSGER